MGLIARMLIIFGIIFLVVGLLLEFGAHFFPFGRLPRDIVIEKSNFKFYFPIITSLLLSLLVILIFLIISWARK